MHKVIYTPPAQENMRDIFSYIAEDNPHYAEEVISRVEKSALLLESFPLIGTDVGNNSRMLVEPRYRYKIFYTIENRDVYITAVTKFRDTWDTGRL